MTVDFRALHYIVDLDREALASAGVEGWALGFKDRVRFGELDALRHVNNASYFRWFETMRVRYLEAYGFYHGGEPQIVARRVTADFLRPVTGRPDILVTGRTRSFRESSFVMEYAVFTDDFAATGEAVVVALTEDGSARWPIPDAIRARMQDVDGAVAG